MKKNLFLVSVAALAFASCSDQSTEFVGDSAAQQAREIAFMLVSQPGTRAVVDGISFPDADNFDVVAYLADGGTTAGDFFPSTNFVKNYRGGVSDGASDGYWAGTTARYWPLSASHINFLAVTNTSGNGVTGKVTNHFGTDATTSAEGSGNFASLAVTALTGNEGADVWSQADLMYAAGQGKVTQTSGQNTITFNNEQGKVDMEFQHALAWIDFKVKTSTTTTGVDIKVNSITLNNAHYNGTYTITNDGTQTGYDGNTFSIGYNTTTDNTTVANWHNLVGVWSNSTSTATKVVPNTAYTAAAGQSATLTAIPAQYGGGLLVIPDGSAADANGVNYATGFTMNYTITQGNVATTYNYTYTFADAEKIWKQRKHYTYIIDITLHETLVSPSVTDWTNVDPHIVAVPQFSYAEGDVAGTYNVANTAGIYTATITGCAVSTEYTISEESDANWIEESTSATSDANGNLTFSFTVNAQEASAAARNVNLVFTNSTNYTKVNISQAAGD